jgi:hypothetical protein
MESRGVKIRVKKIRLPSPGRVGRVGLGLARDRGILAEVPMLARFR